MTLQIDVFSDIICPWCYIGEQKLETALALFRAERPDVAVHLHWQPFELNPTMPPEGLDRKTYRSAKFGSWAKSQSLDAGVARAGAEVGLTFDFEKSTRTPNTLDGHRLLWLALGAAEAAGLIAPQGPAVQQDLARQLFRAYFTDGHNLNDRAVLVQLAAAVGMPAADVAAFLAGNEGVAAVRSLESQAQQMGVTSVPFLLFDRQYAVTGAQPVAVLLNLLQQLAGASEAPVSAAAAADCADGTCAISANSL
ncbi:MAG: DsbA family oxidoreductase [Janthinobacterium lividum]